MHLLMLVIVMLFTDTADAANDLIAVDAT